MRRLPRIFLIWFFVCLQAMAPLAHAHFGREQLDHGGMMHIHTDAIAAFADAHLHAAHRDTSAFADHLRVAQAHQPKHSHPEVDIDPGLTGHAVAPAPAAMLATTHPRPADAVTPCQLAWQTPPSHAPPTDPPHLRPLTLAPPAC
jgi:hypothetical protein